MILSLGIDPSAKATAIALVDVDPALPRPRLVAVRVVQPATDRACDWSFAASAAIESLRTAAGGDARPAYIASECNPSGRGFQAGAKIQQAAGAIVQAMWHHGWDLDRVEMITTARWASLCKVARKKLGDGNASGLHRIGEAKALVECAPDAFDGLGKADVDAAEAVLIALAAKLSVDKPVTKAKKPKAERVAKPRVRKGRTA